MASPDDLGHNEGPTNAGRFHPFLEKLGLHRAELRAWAMYDWANSAMVTTIITAVFPFITPAWPATECSIAKRLRRPRFATATVIGMVIIASCRPCWGLLPT